MMRAVDWQGCVKLAPETKSTQVHSDEASVEGATVAVLGTLVLIVPTAPRTACAVNVMVSPTASVGMVVLSDSDELAKVLQNALVVGAQDQFTLAKSLGKASVSETCVAATTPAFLTATLYATV